jgi:hypothetical protein
MTPGSWPRLLTIMGSGETSPTMTKTHRQLLSRLGPPPVPAVVLDTAFGFQENADDIATRAQDYFRESVGAEIEVASFRSAEDLDPARRAAWLARIRDARYVFAGPGSPSYALRQWGPAGLEGQLRDKLRPGGTGGGITFASAAALTLGAATVPVYEIYKVGEAPRWLPGMGVLGEAGLSAAVIPHYNNAEGGNHDTRYCYLGERRLSRMEEDLEEGVFVLGVDEHTGLILDLDQGSATVVGLGVVTVRAGGRSAEIPTGSTVPIASLAERAEKLAHGSRAAPASSPPTAPDTDSLRPAGRQARSPLLATTADLQGSFDDAVEARDTEGAVRAILQLDQELVDWSRDTLQSDELDRARDAMHAMVASLGRLAEKGARDPREVVGPFVDALLEQRARARAEHRYGDADRIRDRLVQAGIEVRDGPAGTEWLLAGS